MQTLGIDIETYSSAKLDDCGVFKYVESEDFEVLIICYCIDDGPVIVWDETDTEFEKLLMDPDVIKTAHNAPFERACLSKKFGKYMPPEQWRCTMVLSSNCGYPLSLDMVGAALQLETRKDPKGKALIKYFCQPCKPTKVNGGRTRNYPHHNWEKWNEFIGYCIKDVKVEQAVRRKLAYFTIPNSELRLWELDQKINERGVKADIPFIKNAIDIYYENLDDLTEEITEITRLDNPNSLPQLKRWLSKKVGYPIDKLSKETYPQLLRDTEGEAHRVIEIRMGMAKSSIKKYFSMLHAVCKDERLRGMLQFYGASTGRWAGRIIQPHNLPRITFEKKHDNLGIARKLVAEHDTKGLDFLFNVPNTLSQLIRPALIPSKNSRFIIADYSAIEARVTAWYANEKWRLKVFEENGDIYIVSAAAMFKIPLEQIGKDSPLRQQGKVAELALGFQGGESALAIMDSKRVIPSDQYEIIVKAWRKASPNIVKFWYGVQDAAITAVRERVTVKYARVIFYVKNNTLFIQLPSGRCLSYPEPMLRQNQFGRDSLWFKAIHEKTRQWVYQSTYGGKLVENIVQATARDLLAHSMRRIDKAGYEIALHVHDEIVCDVPNGFGSIEEISRLMSTEVPWAKGLPLNAEAYECSYYKKD